MSKPKYHLSAMLPPDSQADLSTIQEALSRHAVGYDGTASAAVRHALALAAELIRAVPGGGVPTRPYVASVVRALATRV